MMLFPFEGTFCSTFNISINTGVVVEALRYKLEGRRFDSRWCHWIFSFT
jgi:hypothetical protein